MPKLNKEQNQQLKRLITEKDQHNETILNVQSTNNELDQQATSLKRVILEFEIIIHSLEKRKSKGNQNLLEVPEKILVKH